MESNNLYKLKFKLGDSCLRSNCTVSLDFLFSIYEAEISLLTNKSEVLSSDYFE